MTDNTITLSNTFTFSSTTHNFNIKWTRLGNSNNPPLIFIHGTPWSSFEWHDLASTLSSDFSVYIYDHPGFESSPQPERIDGTEPDLDPSLSLRAEASAALIRHWNLSSPPHVVAHDNGGLVSLRLRIEHKLTFASLCLIDVVALGAEPVPFFELVAKNKPVFDAIPSRFLEGFVRAYVRGATYNPMASDIEERLIAQWIEGGKQGPKRFLQEIEQAYHRDVGNLTEKYTVVGQNVPVKVIWGADDDWIPVERASRLFKALNAKELVVVEHAGHLVQFDQPGKLAYEVGSWLRKNAGL